MTTTDIGPLAKEPPIGVEDLDPALRISDERKEGYQQAKHSVKSG